MLIMKKPCFNNSVIFFEIDFWKAYVKDWWKYGSILIIQKWLIRIWLGFFKEGFHIKVYCLMIHHTLVIIDNLEWNYEIQYEPSISYHFSQPTNP
jgi:hypothetical protein